LPETLGSKQDGTARDFAGWIAQSGVMFRKLRFLLRVYIPKVAAGKAGVGA
jgi:hypothetical protein